MKKCILIGALAALMLFAFTACEQPSISMGDHSLSDVQYVSGPLKYYVGETFDPSAYTVRLVYADNQSPVEVNGAAYLSVAADSWKVTSPATSAVIGVKSVKNVGSATDIFNVTLYEANVLVDITDAIKNVASDAKTGDEVSLEGVTAKFVAADGTNEDYDISNLVAVLGSSNEVTVASKDGYRVSLVKGTESATWTVTKDQAPATKINGLLVRWEKADKTVVETPYVGQNKATAGDDQVTLKVYATIDGKISGDALSTSDYKVYGSVATLPVATTDLPTQDKAVTVSIVYVKDPSVATGFTYYGVDYATELTVTLKTGSGATNVVQGGAVSSAIEKVEVKYASGASKEVTNYVLSPATIPNDQPTGATTVYAYLENAGKDGATLIDEFSVTVTAAQ